MSVGIMKVFARSHCWNCLNVVSRGEALKGKWKNTQCTAAAEKILIKHNDRSSTFILYVSIQFSVEIKKIPSN